jgi:putative transposase
MILVEQQIIKPFDQRYKPLIEMCHWSKDLYNAALYNIRQHYFETKNDTSVKYKFLSSIENWKILKNQEVFKKLQSNCAKSILRQVDSTFKSFFSLLHKKNKGEYIGQVKIPSYKDKRGTNILVYQGCDFYQKWVSRGLLKIPKTNIFIKTKQKNIIQVRIIPKGNHLVAEVLYEKKEALVKKDNKKYAAIDFGINNLCTVVSNCCKSFIINGRPVKSINQFYNKKKAKLQKRIKKCQNKYKSKKLNTLGEKRNRKIKDYFHKASRYIVNQLVSNDINTLIIGYNKGWKQEVNIGRKNNQNFVQIPFMMLREMLAYKCQLVGINVIVTEESYTSKCSFIDNEDIGKKEVYAGKRVKRGLYCTKDGKLINADINGSYNIMRKGLAKASLDDEIISYPECRGFVYNPYKCSLK